MASSVATEAPLRERALSLARAVPALVWLTGLVALSTLVRYALGRRMVGPWIMVDELIYSELAKSFAAAGHLQIREQVTGHYGFVYPVLISPAYRFFSSLPEAYGAVKAINALAMSLTAVPIYLLARRALRPGLALVAALLTVAVPSMVYTGTVMTENAFYPAFALAALALVVYLERPTLLRLGLLAASFVLAFATRSQAAALVPAILVAPLVEVALARRGWRSLRPHRLLYGAAAGGAALVVLFQLARGRSLTSLLGAYQAAGEQHYSVGPVARWFLFHVTELDLYLGVIPFAGLLLLAVTARGLPRPVQAIAAAGISLSFWLVLEVAIFASQTSVARVEERNMFYVAPLFFVALLVWIEAGMPRPGRAGLAVAAAAALAPAVPFALLIGPTIVSDTLALIPWWQWQETIVKGEAVPGIVALASIAAAGLLLLLPRRLGLVLPALVLVYFALIARPIEDGPHGVRHASVGALFQGITNPHRDWIDRAVGRDASVSALWTGASDAYTIWENEFFNRSVQRVFDAGGPLPGGLPETPLREDKATGLMHGPDGRPVRVSYLLADGSFVPAGTPVASDERKGLVLYRVDGPIRSTTHVTGLYPNDTWSGPRVTYTRRDCRGGKLTVGLASDPGLFRGPQTVVARAGGRALGSVRLLPTSPVTWILRLRPRGRDCTVSFAVSPTAVPAVVTNGRNPDARVLGVHFSSFAYKPPPG